jgi:hypothetical protein
MQYPHYDPMWPNNGSSHNGALLFLISIFATVMDFGCALLSFTERMHGDYCWRIMEADRVWGRRRGIMVKSGDSIMNWGGWGCMAAEEWEIQRLEGKFGSGRFWEWEGESCKRRSGWRELVVKEDEGRLCRRIPKMCK